MSCEPGRASPVCKSCAKPLSESAIRRGCKTGLCGSCYHASIRIDRRCCECSAKLKKIGAKRCQPCNNRWLASDEDRERRRIARSLEARRSEDARARHAVANRRAAARRLAWLPEEHREEYRRRVKRFGQANAKAAVLAKMTPFERQLARVLSGQARVVAKIPLTPRGYERSLIGSSSALVAEA